MKIKRSKKQSLNAKIRRIKLMIARPKFYGSLAVLFIGLSFFAYGIGYLRSVYAESQWTADDFTYQDATITGFSDSGAEKIKLIKELYLPDKNPSGQNITAIKDFTVLQDQDNPKAFMKKGITFLKLPVNIEVVGQEAFLDNKITNIAFPVTTRIIQTSAFAQNQLTKIDLPDSITTIVNSSFRQNKISGTLTIPKDVTEIGEAAFAHNYNKIMREQKMSFEEIVVKDGRFWEKQITQIMRNQEVECR